MVDLQRRYTIPTDKTYFVGGNINDGDAAKAAGTSIAWNHDLVESDHFFNEEIHDDDFISIVNRIFPLA